MNINDVRNLARTLFLIGVQAAEPGLAVKRELDAHPLGITPQGRILLIAFGKAACAMIEQALQHVPQGQPVKAIAVTNYENARDIDGCTVFASGHPLPDQNGLNAGVEIMRLLATTTPQDKVVCLISGGGSALLPTPRDGISLEDKILVSRILLSEGLNINQMNAVRQQLSALKGGGLSAMAHPAEIRSLIISDVVGDDISAIASGPTAPPSGGMEDTIALLKSRNIWPKLPTTAQTLLMSPRPVMPGNCDNKIICSNPQSLQAIADAASEWSAQIVPEPLVGDVGQAANQIIESARDLSTKSRQLLIWGGETTVQLTGKGRGGRNQELAALVASALADLPGHWVFLSGGTDGRDGPTDAAGGIVTAGTIARAQANNINVVGALRDNDSYRILEAAGDLLMTGATGTNVADIQLLFKID